MKVMTLVGVLARVKRCRMDGEGSDRLKGDEKVVGEAESKTRKLSEDGRSQVG